VIIKKKKLTRKEILCYGLVLYLIVFNNMRNKKQLLNKWPPDHIALCFVDFVFIVPAPIFAGFCDIAFTGNHGAFVVAKIQVHNAISRAKSLRLGC